MSEEGAFVVTEVLREKIRKFSRNNRDLQRNSDNDSLRFGLGEIQSKIAELENLTEKDVQGLANRIKRRKHANAEDMYRLNHAFLQGIENIRTFAKIQGAIQVLVKELTGKEVEQQIHASETLCNLSLGEAPVCEKIASMAGSYLVTYLDSTEERLKRTCLWTLANVMATGGKGALAMMSMEIVPKLVNLYLSDAEEDDYREDAAIVLDIVASSREKLLRPLDREILLKKMHMKTPTSPASEYHLKIIFHSEIISPESPGTPEQIAYLVNFCLASITQTPDFEGTVNRMRILYGTRMLANLLALNAGCFNVVIEKCAVWDSNLVQMLNRLFGFGNQNLSVEVMWLVKNVVACQSQAFPAADFIEHLHIPVGSLPAVESVA